MKNKFKHYWSVCKICGPMVICGKCGNNCCNGGYGYLENGETCDACPSAYDMQSTKLLNYYEELEK